MTLSPLKKLAIVLSTTFFLQGCIVAALGGGAAAAKVGTDPRTAGTQVDDETKSKMPLKKMLISKPKVV